MNKQVVLFGAGKSASTLIKYLLEECLANNWLLTVADSDLGLATSKVGSSPAGKPQQINVQDQEQRSFLIKDADLVISLLPPSLHFLVATDCLRFGKDLLTASYLDDKIRSLSKDIKNSGLMFLCEMGLDPGIDHMSAMRLINDIKQRDGQIVSFKSYCGGLVAPESDDNPWHYKISWNPKNIVSAGSSGATFKEQGVITRLTHQQLFTDCKSVLINELGELAYYPNRDSLSYMNLYGLEEAITFMRATLRHPDYCPAWNGIVQAGLTNDKDIISVAKTTYRDWATPLLNYTNAANEKQFQYLGLFENETIPAHLKTSSEILQYLLEKKLMMQHDDKDLVVMLHEIDFLSGNVLHRVQSSLILKGDDSVNTAMSKSVGLPLGIAAGLILKEKMLLTGLHIPVIPEIYDPVLNQLDRLGVIFKEHEVIIKEDQHKKN